MIMPFIGEQGQKVIQNAWVVIIGVGGLGCAAAAALAGAGVGRLTLVDPDRVSISNLHRQFIFSNQDIENKKVDVANTFLKERSGNLIVDAVDCNVQETAEMDFWKSCDVVIDATDNFEARFFINDLCGTVQKPLIFGGVFQMEAHLAIFHKPNSTGESFQLRDLYPNIESAQTAKSCNLAGVLPTTTGVLGNMQAQLALACVLNQELPVGELITIDLLTLSSTAITMVSRQSAEPKSKVLSTMIKEITIDELAALRSAGSSHFLIDVREKDEFAVCEMGGTLIPMSEIGSRWSEIPKEGRVIVHCRSGMRSANVIRFLQEQEGYTNLENLKGGILAWIEKYDQSQKSY